MATTTTLHIEDLSRGPFLPLPGSSWKAVPAWVEDPSTGKRKPSGQQERDENGLPLWEVSVLAQRVTFGRVEPELVTLRTASMTKPEGVLS